MVFSKIEIIDSKQYVEINMLENEIRKNKNLEQSLNEINKLFDKWEKELNPIFYKGIKKIIDKTLGGEK